jgi:hypothetical protein
VRAKSTFRETDVRRLIRAARAAGVDVGRIEVGADGRIVVVAKGVEPQGVGGAVNEWDSVLEQTNGTQAETRKRLS